MSYKTKQTKEQLGIIYTDPDTGLKVYAQDGFTKFIMNEENDTVTIGGTEQIEESEELITEEI